MKTNLQSLADCVNIFVADIEPGNAHEDRELIFTKFYRFIGLDGKRRQISGLWTGICNSQTGGGTAQWKNLGRERKGFCFLCVSAPHINNTVAADFDLL